MLYIDEPQVALGSKDDAHAARVKWRLRVVATGRAVEAETAK